MKKVLNCFYVHRSDISSLGEVMKNDEHMQILEDALYYAYLHYIPADVIKYDKTTGNISIIETIGWDLYFEPIVGTSHIFSKKNCIPKIIEGEKTVYHQKHLFVSPYYTGFNLQDSIARTELLESIPWYKKNKSRIGSKRIWYKFLDNYKLPIIMPEHL